jgi:hypothetical protein
VARRWKHRFEREEIQYPEFQRFVLLRSIKVVFSKFKKQRKRPGAVVSTFNPMRLGGSWYKNSLGKKLTRLPSQPVTGHGGTCLSSQLLGKHK